MGADDEQELMVRVIPFCSCMHRPDYEGGRPMGEPTLMWRAGEYDVLGTEETYVVIAAHRKACQLQADLFAQEDE